MESPAELLALDDETAKRLVRDAGEMIRAGKTESALVLLHSVHQFLRTASSSPSRLTETVNANLGICYLNSSDPIRAIKYLTRALGCAGGVHQAPALINLSMAHFRLSDYDTALLQALKAVKLYENAPKSAHDDKMQAKGLLIVAMCHEAQNHLQKALFNYFKALCFAIERLPPEDDVRRSINEKYEALAKGKSGKKTLNLSIEVGNRRKVRKNVIKSGKIKGKVEIGVGNKPKNPVFRLKPQAAKAAITTRLAHHHKSHTIFEPSVSENTLSSSFSNTSFSPRVNSNSSVEMQERIASIEEKLDYMSVRLRKYGEINREVEKKAEEGKRRGKESGSKRTLFRVHSLTRVVKPVLKDEVRYSMYRHS